MKKITITICLLLMLGCAGSQVYDNVHQLQGVHGWAFLQTRGGVTRYATKCVVKLEPIDMTDVYDLRTTRTMTDATGRFEFKNVNAGKYRLILYYPVVTNFVDLLFRQDLRPGGTITEVVNVIDEPLKVVLIAKR